MEELLQSTVVRVIVGVVVVLIVVDVVRKLFAKPKQDDLRVQVLCVACGWRGRVGKYNRRCAQCGSTSVSDRL